MVSRRGAWKVVTVYALYSVVLMYVMYLLGFHAGARSKTNSPFHQSLWAMVAGGVSNGNTVLQEELRRKIIDHRHLPTNISKRWIGAAHQPKIILELLKGKRNGTFIEAGANNGTHSSNTLLLEMEYGWRGLLVEPVPDFYQTMVSIGRSSMFLEACLSPKLYSYNVTMKVPISPNNGAWPGSAHMVDHDLVHKHIQYEKTAAVKEILVPCYPLYDIMVASNLTTLDALMLDVQGPEIAILQTLPWHLLDIKIVQLENALIIGGNRKTKEHKLLLEVAHLLEPHGYRFYKTHDLDHIFVKSLQ